MGRRQRVGDEPPVGVYGRVQERRQRLGVGHYAGREVAELFGDAIGVGAVGECVVAVAVEREVEVESRAALVVERFTHERGDQAVYRGHVLYGALQAESSVGGRQRGRVLQVDLVL